MKCMKKWLARAILLAAVVGTGLGVQAETAEIDGIIWTYYIQRFSYDESYNYAYVTKVSGDVTGDVTIPSSLGGYPVRYIKEQAFVNCANMTSIKVPPCVQAFFEEAFRGCTGLNAVYVDDVATWCSISFSYDWNSNRANSTCNPLTYAKNLYVNGELLKDLVVPDSVTSLGNGFYGYTNLTSVVISDYCKRIDSWAFRGCPNLERVDTGDGVTYIGPLTFADCRRLKEVRIGKSVMWIGLGGNYYGDGAFLRCTGLENIEIPGHVQGICVGSFYGCEALTNVILRSGIKTIGNSAFACCYSLTHIEIPNSVTSIGGEAFWSCRNLTHIEIPDSVTLIGAQAFAACKQLESIVIPNSVTNIGAYAFRDCPKLASVYIDDLESWCSIDFKQSNGMNTIGNPLMNNPELYVAGVPVGKTLTLPNTIRDIPQGAFYGWTNITSVTIPNSVTNIGNSAFCNCKGLQNVVIGDGVQTIQDDAFYYCDSLKNVLLGTGIKRIGDRAFNGCSSMEDIFFPTSVTEIGSIAFASCKNLARIVFTGNGPTMGSSVFGSTVSDGTKAGCTAYVPWGSTGWGVEIPGKWNRIDIAYLFSEKTEVAADELPETIAVQPGADVTVKVDHDMLVAELKALIAKCLALSRDPAQDSGYFTINGDYDAVKSTVNIKAIIDATKIGVDETLVEVASEDALSTFKADGTMRLTAVKDGFYYGVAVAEDLDGLDAAVEAVKAKGLTKAENGEVSLSLEKPTGNRAFFKVVVSDSAHE